VVESLLFLSPAQQICYYKWKFFGGYIALLMDRIFVDCCKPEAIASLNTSYLQLVPPTATVPLRARPHRVGRRKIYLKGSLQISGENSQDWVDAIKTEALFMRLNNWVNGHCHLYQLMYPLSVLILAYLGSHELRNKVPSRIRELFICLPGEG
jgi:hypothetical protein